MNDPVDSSAQLPDTVVFRPIQGRGMRLAFAATICRHTGGGGRMAGANASDSTEYDQKGLRIRRSSYPKTADERHVVFVHRTVALLE